MLWFALTAILDIALLIASWINNTDLILGLIVLGFLSVAGLLFSLFQSTRSKVIGKGYSYACLLCGYHWALREGESSPQVHVRADLIAMGARRLEEEEEAERKRQEEREAERRRKREQEERERRELEKRMRDSGMF